MNQNLTLKRIFLVKIVATLDNFMQSANFLGQQSDYCHFSL